LIQGQHQLVEEHRDHEHSQAEHMKKLRTQSSNELERKTTVSEV
jgi:hypothetical protein